MRWPAPSARRRGATWRSGSRTRSRTRSRRCASRCTGCSAASNSCPKPERAAVRDSLAALLQEVEHLTRLAEHFSQYARLPEPQREPLDLGELARAAVALHEPEGVTLRVALRRARARARRPLAAVARAA